MKKFNTIFLILIFALGYLSGFYMSEFNHSEKLDEIKYGYSTMLTDAIYDSLDLSLMVVKNDDAEKLKARAEMIMKRYHEIHPELTFEPNNNINRKIRDLYVEYEKIKQRDQ